MSKLAVILRSDNNKNECIHLVLDSLMIQTYKPDKIIFWNYNSDDCSLFNIISNAYDINNDEIINCDLEVNNPAIKDFDILVGITSRDILNINFLKYHKDILEKNNCITTSIESEFVDQGLCHYYPNHDRIKDITWNRVESFIYTYDSVSLDNFGVSKSLLNNSRFINSEFFLNCKNKLIPCLTHKYLHKINIPKNIL